MPTYETYRTEYGYQLLRQYSRKKGTQIDLLRRPDGSTFICRYFDHPVPAYEKLLGQDLDALPKVHRYMETSDGGTLVEEEFVDGLSLSQILTSYRLNTYQVCAIVSAVCRALSVLHKNDLIHRDVKPENILLTSSGRVVLLDLDAASKHSAGSDRDTQLLGTVGYAAPEQFGFGRSDERTDIFSLGVLMNVSLTGQHPSQVLAEGPLRPIIEKCIEVNSNKRYPSVDALLRQLPKCEPAQLCPTCGFTSPGGGCIYCGTPVKPKRNRRWIWGFACAAAIIAAALFLITHFPSTQQHIPDEPPSSAEEEAIPAHTLTEDMIYLGEYPDNPPHIVSFTLPGKYGDDTVYYMGTALYGHDQPSQNHGMSSVLDENDQETKTFYIAFWTSPADREYTLVTDETVLSNIREAFGGTLELQMRALNADNTLPKAYPGLAPTSLVNTWQYPLSPMLTIENAGTWIFTATGTINDVDISCDVRLDWEPLEGIYWEPIVASETDVITQVNQYMETVEADESQCLMITLPAGEFYGYIHVPQACRAARVVIQGSRSSDSPTILHGGAQSALPSTTIERVHFIGAGSSAETWSDTNGSAAINAGTPNYALYGDESITFGDCAFEEYHRAVHCSAAFHKCSENLFQNNGTAYFVDIGNSRGSSLNLKNCTFENNQTAIHFLSLPDNRKFGRNDLCENQFKNNMVDIRNDTHCEIDVSNNDFSA